MTGRAKMTNMMFILRIFWLVGYTYLTAVDEFKGRRALYLSFSGRGWTFHPRREKVRTFLDFTFSTLLYICWRGAYYSSNSYQWMTFFLSFQISTQRRVSPSLKMVVNKAYGPMNHVVNKAMWEDCKAGNVEEVRRALESGADPNSHEESWT